MRYQNPGKIPRPDHDRFRRYGFPAVTGSLAFLLAILFWLFLGPAFVAVATFLPFEGTMQAYIEANAPFLAMALGLYIGTRGLPGTGAKTLVTDKPRIDRTLLLRSIVSYAAMLSAFTLFGMLLHPDRYRPGTGTLVQMLALLPFVLVLTPLQTTSEELLMRCLPVRIASKNGLPARTGHRILVSTVTALLFALPHLSNQELSFAQSKSATVCYYLLFGFAGTYLSLVAGGFEVSIGIHAANNLFVALVCNYEHSSLPSLPLLRSYGPIGTWAEVAQLGLALGFVYLCLPRSGNTSASAHRNSFPSEPSRPDDA
jgi:membrane protease YdiL (CAAX protease family)